MRKVKGILGITVVIGSMFLYFLNIISFATAALCILLVRIVFAK